MADKRNIKSKERETRREELVRFLQERGKLQYVFDIIEKLEDGKQELDALQIQRLRAAMDARINLLKKYLPDLKSVEMEAKIAVSSADNWADEDDS